MRNADRLAIDIMNKINSELKRDPKTEYIDQMGEENMERLDKAASTLFDLINDVSFEVVVSGCYQKPMREITKEEIKKYKADPENTMYMIASLGRHQIMALNMLISNFHDQLGHIERAGIIGKLAKQKDFKQKGDNNK